MPPKPIPPTPPKPMPPMPPKPMPPKPVPPNVLVPIMPNMGNMALPHPLPWHGLLPIIASTRSCGHLPVLVQDPSEAPRNATGPLPPLHVLLHLHHLRCHHYRYPLQAKHRAPPRYNPPT